MFVKPLGVYLEHGNASMRIAIDETLTVSHSLVLNAYIIRNSTSLARRKTFVLTLVPVLCGDGRGLVSMLLRRCLIMPIGAMKYTASNRICIAALENA